VDREGSSLAAYQDQIAFSIEGYYRNDDAKSIATLGKWAVGASTGRPLRKAAANALALIHSPETIPHLVSLMESGDVDLEALGTGGLAMFANGVRKIGAGPMAHFSPSSAPGKYRSEETIQRFTLDVDRFKADRAGNLAFWRSWWRQHGAEILAGIH
jgi:hypothetical protein